MVVAIVSSLRSDMQEAKYVFGYFSNHLIELNFIYPDELDLNH
jgi:hypothetical protein